MFICYRTCFAILHRIFNGKCEKRCLFLCYVVVGNSVAFVFDLSLLKKGNRQGLPANAGAESFQGI